MSAIKAAYEAALADLHNAAAKLEQIGHDGWARVKEIARELEGDAPKLADEAKTDAEDAGELVVEAGHDVATAVQDAAHTPQQTAAVIAAETAVAEQPSA